MSAPLPRRLLVGAALASVAVGVLVVAGLRVVQPRMQAVSVEEQMGAIDAEACETDPAAWGWESGDISFFAYDRDGRSLNPDAPPLDADQLERLSNEGRPVMSTPSGRVQWLVPRAADGPCALVRVTSKDVQPVVSPRIFRVLLGAILTGMFLAVMGTFLLVVRPLRTRIDRVAAAARSVGSASFAHPPGTTDALGHITDVLARSHDRIVASTEALEARNKALERHLAGVAHDLRTPLASMHLALEALAAASEGPMRDEARRSLADAVYLSAMVENLHQATRLRHEFDVTSGTVDLTDLVQRIEKRFAIVGRHAGIEVAANTPEDELLVACTPALAERAVSNLVQNAVEHNDDPGHVAVTLTRIDGGRRFALAVVDDGPGLPPDALATLQSETFLLDEARRRGPGMGTLITNEVALRAGWTVRYRALEPTGLEVRIEGPIVDEDGPAAGA